MNLTFLGWPSNHILKYSTMLILIASTYFWNNIIFAWSMRPDRHLGPPSRAPKDPNKSHTAAPGARNGADALTKLICLRKDRLPSARPRLQSPRSQFSCFANKMWLERNGDPVFTTRMFFQKVAISHPLAVKGQWTPDFPLETSGSSTWKSFCTIFESFSFHI